MKHNHIQMEDIPSDTAKHEMGVMTSQFSLDLPMNRDGSGTSWAPDITPMYMYMIHGNKWMHMIHGSFFASYNKQDLFNKAHRGGGQFDLPDWFMYGSAHYRQKRIVFGDYHVTLVVNEY